MPKGYWIGRVDVKSDEGYKPYAMGNQACSPRPTQHRPADPVTLRHLLPSL